jgi:hypothetical protein
VSYIHKAACKKIGHVEGSVRVDFVLTNWSAALHPVSWDVGPAQAVVTSRLAVRASSTKAVSWAIRLGVPTSDVMMAKCLHLVRSSI